MLYPGVAQFGSALEWGSRGRRFDSCHSDSKTKGFKKVHSNNFLSLKLLL